MMKHYSVKEFKFLNMGGINAVLSNVNDIKDNDKHDFTYVRINNILGYNNNNNNNNNDNNNNNNNNNNDNNNNNNNNNNNK